MFTIQQLKAKSLPELIEIANGLGVVKPNALSQEALIYEILD
ncbi:MAG TPA: Rho termination factor N-terminal domain-containing protein, partial [Paludibacteraceae bacterium]|nr:Rho termination factor N-terminal domain-containing protein [Paludibacteraceae bacterium]